MVAIHPLVSDAIVIPNFGPRPDLYIIEDHVVTVDVHCGAAVMRGADVFAPGVLSTPKGAAVIVAMLYIALLITLCRSSMW